MLPILAHPSHNVLRIADDTGRTSIIAPYFLVQALNEEGQATQRTPVRVPPRSPVLRPPMDRWEPAPRPTKWPPFSDNRGLCDQKIKKDKV